MKTFSLMSCAPPPISSSTLEFTLFRQLLQQEPVLTLTAPERDFTAIHQLSSRTNSL